MNRTLWISASGMEAQQTLTAAIANNMANVNTTGYKKSVVHFQDMLYQNMATPGSANAASDQPVGIQIGSGVRTGAVTKTFSQGTLRNSSSPLDLAIEGEGFFQVVTPDGNMAYTRDGSFHQDAGGQVVTSEGYRIANFPQLNPGATAIDIARDGTVSITVDGVSSVSGRIQLVRFANAEGLQNQGHNLYTETAASGPPQLGAAGQNGHGGVAQYCLEGSNVEIIKEMVDMIASQRAYELNSKSIKSADEMLRMVSNLK